MLSRSNKLKLVTSAAALCLVLYRGRRWLLAKLEALHAPSRVGSLKRREGCSDEMLDLTESASGSGRKRGPVVVADDLEDMELRGEEWRQEAAAMGRGVKKRRL